MVGGSGTGRAVVAAWVLAAWACLPASGQAQTPQPAQAAPPVAASPQLAPGFIQRTAGSTLLVVPADLELFSISAGGVSEPRADWTSAAQRHFREALHARRKAFGTRFKELTARDLDDFAELTALHGAVAEAIFLHHVVGGVWRLPTKPGGLQWSLGDAVAPLRDKTGADYALFFWIRDSYASAQRKATMLAMALLGVGMAGGSQVGYASLVDLRDGRVVWFNALRRNAGDLREPGSAQETLDVLLQAFPSAP
ncbi:MAG: hypothetical protein RI884_1245 [Pseudomonadota bacterium]|jgi:hypothetical protein